MFYLAEFTKTYEQKLSDFREKERERKEAETADKIFIINNTEYTSIPNEERFYTTNPEKTVTALQVMKTELPHITKSLYRKIIPPKKLYLLGDASRRKVLRAVQLNYQCPPITEETTQFKPFFEHLSYNVDGRFEVQQQYSSCRWVTQYQDDELATSMLLHYGWLSDMDKLMAGSSIHQITPLDEGVLIEIEYSHYFQERLEAACTAIDLEIAAKRMSSTQISMPKVLSIGLRTFFYFKERYISISAEYRRMIQNQLNTYIEDSINLFTKEPPPRPVIDEPKDILSDETFLLKWSDFEIVEGVTDAQQQQRNDNNRHSARETLLPKIIGLPRGVELSRTQLPLHDNKITAAAKHGFIFRLGRGRGAKYIINPDIDVL